MGRRELDLRSIVTVLGLVAAAPGVGAHRKSLLRQDREVSVVHHDHEPKPAEIIDLPHAPVCGQPDDITGYGFQDRYSNNGRRARKWALPVASAGTFNNMIVLITK